MRLTLFIFLAICFCCDGSEDNHEIARKDLGDGGGHSHKHGGHHGGGHGHHEHNNKTYIPPPVYDTWYYD